MPKKKIPNPIRENYDYGEDGDFLDKIRKRLKKRKKKMKKESMIPDQTIPYSPPSSTAGGYEKPKPASEMDKQKLSEIAKETLGLTAAVADNFIDWVAGKSSSIFMKVVNPDVMMSAYEEYKYGNVEGTLPSRTDASEIIRDLIKISNELDGKGLFKEADYLDRIIKKKADNQEGADAHWESMTEEERQEQKSIWMKDIQTRVGANPDGQGGPETEKKIKEFFFENFTEARNKVSNPYVPEEQGKENAFKILMEYYRDGLKTGGSPETQSLYDVMEALDYLVGVYQ
ncbi:MAG: hypothetical protein CBE07_001380 [Pelagibacteraceae bacterium TMED247]|nr:MAG: hypothetical protein CBE07_001380 [Pelagibacteraceae bacterium TMED247]